MEPVLAAPPDQPAECEDEKPMQTHADTAKFADGVASDDVVVAGSGPSVATVAEVKDLRAALIELAAKDKELAAKDKELAAKEKENQELRAQMRLEEGVPPA